MALFGSTKQLRLDGPKQGKDESLLNTVTETFRLDDIRRDKMTSSTKDGVQLTHVGVPLQPRKLGFREFSILLPLDGTLCDRICVVLWCY